MSIQVTKPAGGDSLDVYNSGALVGVFGKMDFRGPSVDVSNNANSGTVVVNVSGGGGGTDATKYAQSGETRNLITSGGIVAQGTISGVALHFTDTVVTSGIIVDDVSADAITARIVTTSGIEVRGAATVSGAVNAYGVSLFQAGLVANATVSGLHVTASGLVVNGPISGTSVTLTSGLTSLLVTTSGLVADGPMSGKSLTLTSGLIADGVTANNLSGKSLTLASGLVSDGVAASILSGKSLVLTSGVTADAGTFGSGGIVSTGVISGLSVTASGLTVGGLPTLSGGLVVNGPMSGTSLTLTSGLTSLSVATSSLVVNGPASGTSLTLTSGIIADGVTANIISGKSVTLTSGLVAYSISGATIAATSGFVGNAQSGYVLTSVASGSLATWSAPAGGAAATAYNVFKTGDAYNSITQGTWAILSNTAQFLAGYFANSTKTLGDRLNYKFSHKAGSFTLCIMGFKNTNIGKFEVYVDDALVGTVDEYDVGAAVNVVFTFAITLATDGEHTMHIICIEKNASSTDYWNLITSWWIRD